MHWVLVLIWPSDNVFGRGNGVTFHWTPYSGMGDRLMVYHFGM